ncbi:SBF-like CPA transporter family-domain-containing protein [Scheffersomyces coipomensis]|uniref:SBF-like CPA transporter family-domain-containing protein n=1 Tax=Scheffersomyces coipomensis TaxID=1788519 RepID=UPI00315DCAC4
MPDFTSIKESKPYKIIKTVIDFLIKQWFFVVLGCLVAIAHSYPNFARQGGLIRAEYTIGYGAVAVIFLISGLSMSTKDLAKNTLNWRAHFTVLSTSFLITSSIIYGLATAIRASNDAEINDWLLVGLIVTHACPTTVSSNVVMTKQAHGNDILTLCEVFIGNILGAFVTPALLQLYMTGGWEFGNPSHQAGGDHTITDLYKSTMKQLGLSVFVPLFVGQVIQNLFNKQTKWCLSTFKLAKVGSFMLILIMFQSFSTAFYQDAFTKVSHVSIIFLVFFNIGIYLFFTVLTFFYARPIFIKRIFNHPPDENSTRLYTITYKIFRPFYYSRKDTVAIMLCGPAKTAALGVSLVSSQYGSDNPNLGIILVPLVLYQSEQVISAQVLTNFMKKWIHAEELKEDAENNLPPKNIDGNGNEVDDSADVNDEDDDSSDHVLRHETSISNDSNDHKSRDIAIVRE